VPKPNDDLQDLKRRLALLAKLEGRPLACAEGLTLFAPARVRDPRALAAAIEAGPPAVSAVAAALELRAPPLVLGAAQIAAARRDLKVIEGPRARELLREAPRIFRRYGTIDGTWIARRRAAIDALSAAAPRGAEADPFARALAAIAMLHGQAAATFAERAAAALASAPFSTASGVAKKRAMVERFFSQLGIAFDPTPRAGDPSLDPPAVERALGSLESILHRFGGKKIALADALALAALDLGGDAGAIADLVAGGLPVPLVERLAALGRAGDLASIGGDAATARAYAEWATALVPHYRALGLDLPIEPAMFERFRKTARKEHLAVLAACLMKHHEKADPDTAEAALARLDATIGLFDKHPAEAAAILAELSGTTPGAGRAALPDFAAWLGDDALLDRYVHLARLAGVPVALSRPLRADFERAARLDRERAHLAALASPSPAQRERLRRLESGEVEGADRDKTRRRVADRLRELVAKAYEARLEEVFRRLVKQAWGISLASVTPAWRDAIRFYLAVDRNHELLGAVLRAAAAGEDLTRTRAPNRAWIEEASRKFDVAAWLAPRERTVTIAGRSMRLAIERDPVEVLRMGIPFDTCLSLADGFNAASTVVNAADANKRVIYLRDASGAILARKLVAITEEGTLVGYRLYVATQEGRDEIAAAVRDFCADLAAAARVPLAPGGVVKQIHAGFWYDDGTVAFDAPPNEGPAPVKAYCRAIGLPPPPAPHANDELRRRARVFALLEKQDETGLARALAAGGKGGVLDRAARWLVARLDRERLILASRGGNPVLPAAFERALALGAEETLALAARVQRYHDEETVLAYLHRLPRTAEVAHAFVEAALAARVPRGELDGHGIEHVVLYQLPHLARALPIAASLALCDRFAQLTRWIVEIEPSCSGCVTGGEIELFDAIEAAYAAAPDPESVIHTLGSARSSLFAARAALRIAARYPLGGDPAPLPPPCPQPVRACLAASRALAKLRGRAPDLERDPSLFAAIVRQAGGVPRGTKLPVPSEAPFEALGDLLLQIDLSAELARWTSAQIAKPSAWKPGPWEIAYHRRHATDRRAALVAEAMRRSDETERALDLLGELGDVATLRPLARDAARALAKFRGQKGTLSGVASRALERAREVAAQVEASRAADPIAAARALPAIAVEEGADVALGAAAFARLAAGGPDLEVAGKLAFRTPGAVGAVSAAAARFAAGPTIDEPARSFVARYLRERVPSYTAGVLPHLATTFGHLDDLRPDLVAAMRKAGDDHLGTDAAIRVVEAALTRRGLPASPVIEAWLRAGLDEDWKDTLRRLSDPDLLRTAARLVLAEGSASAFVARYGALTAPESMAIFLDELRQSDLRTSPAMRAAIDVGEWLREPEQAAALFWLRAVVEA
jgi:hypothetical protein